MKTRNIFHVLAGIFSFAAAFSACNRGLNTEPMLPRRDLGDMRVTHTVAELRTMYKPGGYAILSNVVICGQVSTDDSEGNFYKTIDIQDETGGIELKMGLSRMNLLYKRGSTVYVKCSGLQLGQYGGVVNLGYKSTDPKYETGYVPDLMVPRVMIPGAPGALEPRVLTIAQLNPAYANTLIRLDDVQFLLSELGTTWADPIHKTEAGRAQINRTLTDRAGNTVIVRTSSYAKFAGNQIPEGSGSVTALLTYFNEIPQLAVVSLRDIDLHNERFIPAKK